MCFMCQLAKSLALHVFYYVRYTATCYNSFRHFESLKYAWMYLRLKYVFKRKSTKIFHVKNVSRRLDIKQPVFKVCPIIGRHCGKGEGWGKGTSRCMMIRTYITSTKKEVCMLYVYYGITNQKE